MAMTIETGTPTPVLASALSSRITSRGEETYGGTVLSAMRIGFGGHAEAEKDEP